MSHHHELILIGKLKDVNLRALEENYLKQIKPSLNILELQAHDTAGEHIKILEKIKPDKIVITFDERGKHISSRDFAKILDDGAVQCIIGGADGLSNEIRSKSTHIISFGSLTWPHKLARLMAIEQIYRAQQINAGHPYHRD